MSGGEEKKNEGMTMKEHLKAMNKESAPVVTGIEVKEDFTEAVKTLLAEVGVMAANGELSRGIEMCFALEKKCRLGSDIASLKTVCCGMAQLCYDKGDWEKLNTTMTSISKRHQQSRHAITAVLKLAMEWVDTAPDKAAKVAFLTALRDITEGKIYAEAERAKLTRQLAQIKEAEGDIDGATDAMLDVYVETFGALSKREKIDFILEQIRLTILKGDWVRVLIVAKKVQKKFLEEPEMEDLKLRFYGLMVEYYLREKDAFELAQAFHQMYQTPCKLADEDPATGWRQCLQSTVLFLCLAKRSPSQSDMLHRVAKDEKLAELPEWLATIKLFTTDEIVPFPLASQAAVEQQLRGVVKGAVGEVEVEKLFPSWRQATHERTTQHNLRVAAKYYRRIRMDRLAMLLGLSEAESEKELAALVSDGDLFAKIDRPAGIVSFTPKVSPEETLSAWSSDIGQLLTLVERTCHLINKENMIHKI